MKVLDRRLNAYRPDLADIRLKGQVEAARFEDGRLAHVVMPVADLRPEPRGDVGIDTQLLFGDGLRLFDERDGWAWVQSLRDGYVGYVPDAVVALGPTQPSYSVAVPRSFVYSRDDMKSPRTEVLSIGSTVEVTGFTETRGTRYAVLADESFMIAAHLRPIGEFAADYVSVAETLEHTPYLWGGTSGFGVDCSGLVQLAMRMAGRAAPRDTDMQEHSIGEPLDYNPGAGHPDLRRGDLVFWRGHVAIMVDDRTAIHANGHTMLVSREPLATALARIAPTYGEPTSFRRG
jgi:cell wall-associated NlpC family hydrolase